ncbi:MAG: hypothetical protein J6A01_06995 [Proteobacteria bacterium]|nr:hypothetical protein [Pseudomonadota bacterium]
MNEKLCPAGADVIYQKINYMQDNEKICLIIKGNMKDGTALWLRHALPLAAYALHTALKMLLWRLAPPYAASG